MMNKYLGGKYDTNYENDRPGFFSIFFQTW